MDVPRNSNGSSKIDSGTMRTTNSIQVEVVVAQEVVAQEVMEVQEVVEKKVQFNGQTHMEEMQKVHQPSLVHMLIMARKVQEVIILDRDHRISLITRCSWFVHNVTRTDLEFD